MSDLPEILEMLVLGPNDRLVIVVPAGTSTAEVIQFGLALADSPIGDRAVIVAGVEQLAVLASNDVERRLEAVERRLAGVIETHHLWDGS